MDVSRHAKVRCQQRNIPPLIINWLLTYGAEQRSHGATKRFFDREARKRLAAEVGSEVLNRLGDLLNVYIVEGDERIVTAAIRTRRIRRTS
jgi:hypothetical protein